MGGDIGRRTVFAAESSGDPRPDFGRISGGCCAFDLEHRIIARFSLPARRMGCYRSPPLEGRRRLIPSCQRRSWAGDFGTEAISRPGRIG